MKTDDKGNEEWERKFGGEKSDKGYSVQQTLDEGYIIVGYTESFGKGKSDVWMIKTDGDGNVEWEQYYGDSLDDYARFVDLTDDGGYIIVGTTHNTDSVDAELYLMKTDSLGNMEWEKQFMENTHTFGYSVQQTLTGG